jgi:uncharacterized membrane protein
MAVAREIDDIARGMVRHQHDHPPVRDLNREADRRLGRGDRIGDDFMRLVGTWTFVILQGLLILLWLLLNTVAAINHWDPYPFGLLNLFVTLVAAFLASLVLMGLNRLGIRDRLRGQHEYEVSVKSEEELKAIMSHLEAQDDALLQILQRLDRSDRELRKIGRRLEPEETGRERA